MGLAPTWVSNIGVPRCHNIPPNQVRAETECLAHDGATDCSGFNVAATQQLGEEAISYAHAVKIEALAQLGEMLKSMEKNKGGGERGIGRAGKNAVPKENHIVAPPTLEELGIDKKTSMVAQALAKMPEEVREEIANVNGRLL